MANPHFADACDRYTEIIDTVEDENIFKTNQATYDSRYLFEYGEEFVGYKAYKLCYRCLFNLMFVRRIWSYLQTLLCWRAI